MKTINAFGRTATGSTLASGSIYYSLGNEAFVIEDAEGWTVGAALYTHGFKASVSISANAGTLNEAIEHFLVAAESVPAIAARFKPAERVAA